MKLLEISLRGSSMMIIAGVLLLVTCKPKIAETPQAKFAFDTTDMAVQNLPVIFNDTSREFVRTRFASVNPSFFEKEKDRSRDSTLTLRLFNDVSIKLFIESITAGKDSTEVWTLRPDGPRFGIATIITSPSAVYARIQIHTTIYEVFPVGKNIVRIREIDQTKFPSEAPPIEKISKGDRQINNGPTVENPVITVLALLPGAPGSSLVCDDPFFKRLLETIFTNSLNQVFNSIENTGVSAIVEFACVEYTPAAGNLDQDLNWVSSDKNAKVIALRDQHKADLVCLLVPNSDANVCGVGRFNYPVESKDADRGFSVVRLSCAIDNFTFAHELGHNMGMRHDRQTTNQFNSPDCNFGSLFRITRESPPSTEIARTVMAYKEACDGCARYPFYSTPLTKKIPDYVIGPLGAACDMPKVDGKFFRANNRQQLINAAPIVSKFK